MKRTTIALITASWFTVGSLYAADHKAAAAPAPKPVAASAGYKVEVKSSRWRKHSQKNYERFVIEFDRKDSGGAASPSPTVVPAASGKEVTVVVNGVSLGGNINEGKIAEAYGSKSALMGNLDVLSDSSGNGFSMKIGFKKDGAVAEASWLEKPTRLVVDVFPSTTERNAIRASAPDATDADEKVEKAAPAKTADLAAPVKAVVPTPNKAPAPAPALLNPEPVAEKKPGVGTSKDAGALAAAAAAAAASGPGNTAATNEPRSIFSAPTTPKPTRKSRRSQTLGQNLPLPPVPAEPHYDAMMSSSHRDTDYLCFPASAQVGLSVFFKNKRMSSTGEEVRMDIQNTHAKVQSASAIVCYPSTAQVEASISFREDRPMLTGNGGDSVREPAYKK